MTVSGHTILCLCQKTKMHNFLSNIMLRRAKIIKSIVNRFSEKSRKIFKKPRSMINTKYVCWDKIPFLSHIEKISHFGSSEYVTLNSGRGCLFKLV